jgi:uncharacterized DUF497 family protein
MDSGEKYEWNEIKRQGNIDKRGLDIAVFGPEVLEAPDGWVELDNRRDYGEPRANAMEKAL